MKENKLSIILLVLLALIVGFIVGRANIPTPFNGVVDQATQSAQQENTTAEGTNTTNTTNTPTGGTPVGDKLTDGQRKMLESFGLNPDEITITPTMVACAEAKLGASRVAEIEGGATPSMMEGASLLACYK